jgi:hypothetical protein
MIQETFASDLARKQIEAAFASDWPALERLYADDVQRVRRFRLQDQPCLQRQRRRGRRGMEHVR